MKTLNDLDEETQERILKAFQICVEHMDVFGEVEMQKLCSLFADGIFEDDREVRMRKYAPDMYQLLKYVLNSEVDLGEQLEDAIYAGLRVIDGTEDKDE